MNSVLDKDRLLGTNVELTASLLFGITSANRGLTRFA